MGKQLTHDRQKKRRAYRGESEAGPLLKWLNEAPSDEISAMARERVAGIIRRMVALQAKHTRSARRQWAKTKDKSIRTEAGALTELLGRYLCHPGVDFSDPSLFVLCLSEEPGEHARGEAQAVWNAHDLAVHEHLKKIRRCECGVYYFMRTKGQRFHSSQCRERFWEQSPERKAKKRENSKIYYRLHKSGKVK